MIGEKYVCANCHGTFEKTVSEEDARAEQAANGWGSIPSDEMAVVCDDCYRIIQKTMLDLTQPPRVYHKNVPIASIPTRQPPLWLRLWCAIKFGHDYDMVFPTEHSLEWYFVCKHCGHTVKEMPTL